MPRRKTLRLGPVLRSEAREYLREVLGVDPFEDATIRFWGGLRWHALRLRCRYERRVREIGEEHAKVPLTRREVVVRRYGRVNPAYSTARIGEPAPSLYLPPELQNRGHEVREDDANALLLRGHPKLGREPLAFAALEALFDLDATVGADRQLEAETHRFGGPEEWDHDRDGAIRRRDSMRRRASKRLARAGALNEARS